MGLEDSLEEEMATHSSILAWDIHGHRSLVGYSPQHHKELDTTKHHANLPSRPHIWHTYHSCHMPNRSNEDI